MKLLTRLKYSNYQPSDDFPEEAQYEALRRLPEARYERTNINFDALQIALRTNYRTNTKTVKFLVPNDENASKKQH